MNVFILNSGRCGSTTFIAACQHIENFSAGHETRIPLLGAGRLDYPGNHIEADNRLSWLLGRLEQKYGDNAFYVHLRRDPAATAASFEKRLDFGIMKAYREGILLEGLANQTARDQALDYLETVDANIAFFLKDKTHAMPFQMERARQDFPAFWRWIGATGNLQGALAEWETRHNASA